MAEVLKVQVVADTSSAKQQLQNLQQQLQSISSTPINVNNASLVEANKAALELQQTLAKATNPTTGNLDLSIFSRELSKSGQTLQQYQARLASIGPAGSQAFLSLSKAIATAEAPTNRLNAKLIKFGQTIKNTINWQISSTMIHQIVGQFQQAINYAEKLNTSLTNIRIVTGTNVEGMAQFAQQANEAARKLSTTTTAYTNASLIFFQQGLKGKDVTDRADVVIKLANVTGESAEEVSNQMTAIWNNFADGSQSLEHYADVITALGAATASSSKEIATGLEKFAAIANTVGLGYENATAALATITATTRQSAETVGTGLRTIFSRLSSLKLGETLEDGVDLTKYTKALDSVGVKALDAAGSLRDMNDILSDLGERWNFLSRSQQVALAQTVGGVRQYTNIMALMEHYSDYEKNLDIALNSEGTLQKQQETYESGWVAASKRIRASLEDIYNTVINDQSIIKIMDGFAGFLDIIHSVIDGLGGMKGILLMISSLVTNKFAKDLPLVFQNLMSNVRNFFGFSTKEMTQLQGTNQTILAQAYSYGQNPEQDTQIKGLMQINAMNQSLARARNSMTEEEIANYQTLMASTQAYYDALQPLATKAAEAQHESQSNAQAMAANYARPLTRELLDRKIQVDQDIKDVKAQRKIDIKTIQAGPGTTEEKKQAIQGIRAQAGIKMKYLGPEQRQVDQELKKSDDALGSLLAIKRKADDSILKSLELEKAELESRTKENKEREDLLSEKEATGKRLSKREKAELAGYRADEKRLEELTGTTNKPGLIASRESEITQQAQKDAAAVSSSKIIEEKKQRGSYDATTMARRAELEREAMEGLHAAGRKQGAYSELISNVKKQGEIWSSDKIGKMSPQDQAAIKQQMMQYAQAIKTSATENGLGELFSGENDPVEQLKQKLADGKTDAAQAFKEFIDQVTGEAEGTAGEKGREVGQKVTEGVKQAAQQAEGVIGSSSEAKDAITSAIVTGQDEGAAGMANAIPRNIIPPGSETPAKHQTPGIESVTKAASALMMLTSTLKSAESLGKSFSDHTVDNMDKVSAVLGTVATAAMTAGMMIKLAGEIAAGPWAIFLKIASAVVLAGTLIAGYFSGKNKAALENAQKTADNAYESAAEKYSATKEKDIPLEEYNELYNTYQKLAKGSAEAADAQQALIDKAIEVAEAYKDAHLYMAAVAGDIETIAEMADQAEYRQLINETIPDANKQLEAAQTAVNRHMTGTKVGHNAINPDTTQWNSTSRGVRIARENDLFGHGLTHDYSELTIATPSEYGGGSSTSYAEYIEVDEGIEGYRAAMALREKILAELGADLASTDPVFIAMDDYINANQQYYDNFIAAQEALNDANTRQKLLESDIFDSTSLEEYTKKREVLIQTLAKEQGLIDATGKIVSGREAEYQAFVDAIDERLLTSRIGNMAKDFRTINYAAKQSGYSVEELAEKYDELVNEYGEEKGRQYFASIFMDIKSSSGLSVDEAVEQNIDRVRAKLADSELELRISIITQLKTLSGKDDATTGDYKKVFEQMSEDDMIALAESMGLDTTGGYDRSTAAGATNRRQLMTRFLAGSGNQQGVWLTQAEIAARQQQGALLPSQIENSQQQIENIERQIENNAVSMYADNEAAMAYLAAAHMRNSYLSEHGGNINQLTPEELTEYRQLNEAAVEAWSQMDANAKSDLAEDPIPDAVLDSYYELNSELRIEQANLEDLQLQQELYEAGGFRDALQLEAAQWGINYDKVQEYATSLREAGVFEDNEIEKSEGFALAVLKKNAAIKEINDNYAEWVKILNDPQLENSDEALAAVESMTNAFAELLDIDPKKISNALIQWGKQAGNLKRLAEGNKDAWAEVFELQAREMFRTANEAYEEIEGIEDKIKELAKIAAKYKVGELLSPEDAQKAIDLLADYREAYAAAHGGEGPSEQQQLDFLESTANVDTTGLGVNSDGVITRQVAYQIDASSLEEAQSILDAFLAQNPDLEGSFHITQADSIEVESAAMEGAVDATGAIVAAGDLGEASSNVSGGYVITGDAPTTEIVSKGGTGGTGGGGGGGGKKKKDHKKPDSGTRYHTIRAKKANNDQNKQETNRQKERAFGAEKIKQAEKEIKLQKESIELQRQYVDEITDYLAGDRKDMEDQFKGLGITIDIDKDGVITNFRDVEAELLRQENELIDKYNAGSLDDDAYAEEQKKIDDAREALELYEETRDLYEEQMNVLIQQIDELADQLLDLTKIKIDLQISISDEKLEMLDYMLEKINDDAYQAAEAIALLGDKTGETLNRIDIYRSGLEEILGRKGFSIDDLDNLTDLDLASANFTQAEIDQIREWKTELLEANKELLKMRTEVIDKVIDGFDQLNEKVQTSYANFDTYNSVLESYTNIAGLLGLRLNQQHQQLLQDLGRATLTNAQAQAAAAKEIYDTAVQANLEAQKAYQDILAQGYDENSQEAQEWKRVVDSTQEAMDEAQQQWLDAWQAALEQAQAIYSQAIENITKQFEEAVSGLFGSLDYLQSAFERANQVGDEYLQDFEKLYELNKLNRDIQKEIDDSNNIRDKQALKKLQKEINDLQAQGVQLSQYDVDALRKKFELEQARQALEDARNNKSEVRLQRDASGNWGYVYTAAEDEVAAAEQEYENRLYEYQKLNDDYINELQSRILDIQTTYEQTLAEIFDPESGLTEEQRQARLDELNAWRDAELAYFEQQLNNALKNQQDTLDLYYKLYGDSQAKLADSWEETTLRMLSGAGSIEEYIGNIRQAMLDMLTGASDALEQFHQDVDDTDAAAGVNTEDFAQQVSDTIGELGANAEETTLQLHKLSEELLGEFKDSLQEALDWEEDYAAKMQAAIDANERFIQSLNDMIARLAVLESTNPELKAARAAYMAAEAEHERKVSTGEIDKDATDEEWEKAKQAWNDYLTKYTAQFASGGYTGEWGSGGKLAILHEKETVLNEPMTRQLWNYLDQYEQLEKDRLIYDHQFELISQAYNRLDQLASAMTRPTITPISIADDLFPSTSLDQNVHIEATFPNVTDHNEIEAAFDNLINKASQYANRKNMSAMTFNDMYISKF